MGHLYRYGGDVLERALGVLGEAWPDDKQRFEAEQNDKDRQVDLAKTIISKAEAGDDEETVETAMAIALREAAEMMNAPKELTHDEFGNVTGVRTVIQ